MAEFAQRDIEEMLVEVDKMRKVGLFTLDEIRNVMKKRKRFINKMQRRTKEKEVYLEYIRYEISVMQLLKLRREKRHIEVSRDEIEKPIALRIYKLFRIACFRFKSDLKLWLSHIEFAKKNMDREKVSKLYTTLLQIHNKKPHLWIMAAKFEFEMNESVGTARQLFQRALRFLPTDRKIWIEYFKMELLCVELIIKRKELLGIDDANASHPQDSKETLKIEDTILSCKVVEVVFRNAVKQVEEDTARLVHSFVQVAHQFKFARDLIDFMYKFISESEKLNKNEEIWEVLARRNLLEENEIMHKCQESGQVADFTIAELEEKAILVLKQGLEQLPTQKMHTVYIDFCMERLKLNSKFLNDERFTRLNEAFKNANETEFGLSLEQTLEWVETLLKFNHLTEAIQLIDSSLAKNAEYKTNFTLWKHKLVTVIDPTNAPEEKTVFKTFYKAIEHVKIKESLEIWRTILEWCFLNNNLQTEKLLEEGSRVMCGEVSSFVREKFLNWSLQSPAGLSKVRKTYESLRQVPPYDVEFFQKYIEIEKCAPTIDSERISAAFETALTHFGKEDINLWLTYIQFRRIYGNGDPQDVAKLHWRAMKQLDAQLAEVFTHKFCLLKLKLDRDEDTSVSVKKKKNAAPAVDVAEMNV